MIDHVQMGLRMEQARKERGLTLKDVATTIGVAASTVQRYEKGNFSSIKMPVGEAIASALDVNPAWLTGHTDDPVNYTTSMLHDEAQTKAPEMREADIRAAFFNAADPTLTEEEQAAMWADVKEYIHFKLQQTRRTDAK